MNVLLLHAWPLDESMWEPQLEPLRAAGHEPVAPRLYGRGASIDDWAAQLLGEVEGPFVAIGASMGGYCALALARRASERVPGLVLVGSRPDADSADRREFRDGLIATLRTEGVPDDVPETDVPAEELAVAQEAIRDRPDLTGVASSFGGPLLVCVGDRDDIVPVDVARKVAADALLGSLEVFAASHLLSVEEPGRFTEVLLEFLAQWT